VGAARQLDRQFQRVGVPVHTLHDPDRTHPGVFRRPSPRSLSSAALVVEPSAALGVAALLEEPERFAGRRVTTILCASNVSRADFARWVLEPVARK
jgi:threonine dehydratase